MIPESTLAQIQERTDIVELVSGYVPLKRVGRSFKANCPFHHEKTPSFIVNPDKQIFHCFGCGVGGNVFSFFMKIEKRDFRDAVEVLADRAGIEIPDDRPQDTEAARRSAQLVQANGFAVEFYRGVLRDRPEAQGARDYLRRRGVLEKTLEDFRVGFAPDSWDALQRAAKTGAVTEAALERAGLVIGRREGGGYYDRFRNRVIFPILDMKGACVAFGGRVMDDATPKYLNSPETEIYSKGRHLYGLFQARQAVRELDQAIVVEGYMDLIACHQAGVVNVVASLGTALTPEQVRLVKRHTHNVVMLYDADKAGEAATLRGLELFLEEGVEVKVVRLEKGHDPDSFLRERGAGPFREALAAAKNLFEYKLGLLKDRHPAGTVEGKVRIATEMVGVLHKVRNEILRAAWTKELSRDLGLPEEALFAEMRKAAPGPERGGPSPARPEGEVPLLERLLLGLVLDSIEFARTARGAELMPDDFRHPAARRVAGRLLTEDPGVSGAAVLMNFFKDDPEAIEAISLAAAEADRIDGAAEKTKCLFDCLLKVKRSRLRNEREGLRSELLTAERQGDQNRISRLMYDLEELNKREKRIHEKK